MSLAKVPKPMKVPVMVPPRAALQPDHTARGRHTIRAGHLDVIQHGRRPRLIYSAAGPQNLESDLGRFLNLHARRDEGSTLGSTDLLARYNGSRRKRGCPEVTHRSFGDAMNALGHRKRLRLSGGRVHYQGLAWARSRARGDPQTTRRFDDNRQDLAGRVSTSLANVL